MEYKSLEDLRKLLFSFVDRATKKDATAEEVQALPAVARVIAETFR